MHQYGAIAGASREDGLGGICVVGFKAKKSTLAMGKYAYLSH